MSQQSASARRRSVPGLPDLGRSRVMGVLNVTPDSFSDGGLWLDPGRAVEHALELTRAGADLIDVGGESTRPGSQRVTEEEELRRVLPVVRELAARGVVMSVDTMRAAVAEQALEAGAAIINDVSGGLADPRMAAVAAASGAPFVVMHWRGQSAGMDRQAVYQDVVGEVVKEIHDRVAAVLDAGVRPEQLITDPGLGFAKTREHDWALLARIDALAELGFPVLVAASRKRFLGTLLADPETGEPRPPRQRDAATAAVSALAAAAGAWAVRVHDVRATADAVRVEAALRAARGAR
ncbi:dihydropteroate synthase [Phaeacidiphilus oryzae]|uniref:dihydropteroate synthase n=1 Tax=Phaeacidiphilus oryzae TaxID=348818 RepID=UPI000B203F98|nr:dihydropteroate synthase [Phaeacidiphilus oryzae]